MARCRPGKIFNYSLYSKKEGLFFRLAVIVVDGKEYKSDILKLEVLAEDTSYSQDTNQANGKQGKETHEGPSKEKRGKSFRVEAFVNNKNPYVGEQIIYTFRLYYRVKMSNARKGLPEFDGFLKEDLGEGRSYRKVLNGKEWEVYEENYALFPTKAGKIELSQATFMGDILIRDESSRRRGFGSVFDMLDDPFFGSGFGKRKRVTVRSKPVEIDVRPLPEEDKQPKFSGLVGDFKVTSRLDKLTLRKGESTTLTLAIQGRGNVSGTKFEDTEIPGFKIYKDKPVLKVQRSRKGIFGKRVFKWPCAPGDREKGNSRFRLSYFDPSTGI